MLKDGFALNNLNGTILLEYMVKLNFTGVTGVVNFDQNYDRKGYEGKFSVI